MKRRPLNLKPRNPTVVVLKTRRGGAHGKTAKAIRQQQRQALVRELAAQDKTE
jgi:hypothetical protein